MKSLLSYLCALLVLAPLVGSADTIVSINIAGGNEDAPGTGDPPPAGQGIVTGAAGIGQFENWNNAIGTSGDIPLINSTGVPSGASVTWVTNNTWSTQTADAAGTDADMMSGYLDNFHANGSIDVRGLGSEFTTAGYEILVYFQNDNDDNTAGFTATDSLGNTDTRYGHQDIANSNWPLAGAGAGPNGYIVSTDTDSATLNPSNVVRLTGLSGPDFSLVGIAGTGAASTRARPNAVQIITTGESLDNDMDGLPKEWEESNGLSDSDDGSIDINNGPEGDPDMDLLVNGDEFSRGTDPQKPDTDDDGLTDKVEDNTGTYVDLTLTGSNPLRADSDGDTLPDGSEVEENPYFSNPNMADTDADGLRDDSELEANPYVTNPNSEDTDGDTYSDPIEIAVGTDPTDPDSFPAPVGGTSIGINFNSDRDTAAVLMPDEIAGAPLVAQGNWNSSDGGADAAAGANGNEMSIISPVPGGLVDSEGGSVPTTVTWTSNGTWNTTNGSASPDAKLMNGYIDAINDGGFTTIDFAQIPYPKYDVYVYFGSDGNGRTGAVESATAGVTYSYSTFSNDPNGGGGFEPGVDYVVTSDTEGGNPPANYCIFSEQTSAEFSLQINRGSANSGIHGIQIVGTEPPIPLEITSITYDEETNIVTLVWNSTPDTIYAVDSSLDLAGWPSDVDDSIPSEGTTTTYTFDGPPEGTTRIFYRVRESE
ncbi:MAG: hypothetical protein ACR2RV_05285 [Verrucomicrobiales bacterium]